jgi:hypothetical protein
MSLFQQELRKRLGRHTERLYARKNIGNSLWDHASQPNLIEPPVNNVTAPLELVHHLTLQNPEDLLEP